jgi:hypothetical protein
LAKPESTSIELEQIREATANDPSVISSVCPAQQGFSYQSRLFVRQSLVLKCRVKDGSGCVFRSFRVLVSEEVVRRQQVRRRF